MLSSMTGFAYKSHDDAWGSLTWELKSVNHRYLEISIRLPEPLRDNEAAIREMIKKNLSRGKVEVTLKLKLEDTESVDYELNRNALQKLADTYRDVNHYFPNAQTNFTELLSWQGVLLAKEKNFAEVNTVLLNSLQAAMDDLKAVRVREGESLQAFILARLDDMQQQISLIEQQYPVALEADRKRILDRFLQLQLELNSERLEQEMLWVLQKADIAEEISRLKTHVLEVERVVKQGGVVGRRLDFLMQELNRESNTIASKSIDAVVSQASIELKVLIEQMREQVQNIE